MNPRVEIAVLSINLNVMPVVVCGEVYIKRQMESPDYKRDGEVMMK